MSTDDDLHKQLRSSLRFTRLMVLLLAILIVFLQVQNWRKAAVLRRLTDRSNWLYPYVPNLDRNFDFTIDFYGMKFSGNTYDDYGVFYAGATEKPDIYFMRDAMKSLQPQGGVFIDIGASTGHHSMFMSKYAKWVVAFEPYPPALERIQGMVDSNSLENIEIVPVGLGAENLKIPFYAQSGGRLNTGSFQESFSDDNELFRELDIRIGDEELAKLDLPSVDIVKIDVEGFEKSVLQGLENTLVSQRPVVLMELLSGATNREGGFENYQDLQKSFPKDYDFLQFAEYELYTGAYRLEPLDFTAQVNARSPDLEVTPRNIVACPKEKIDRIVMSNRNAEND